MGFLGVYKAVYDYAPQAEGELQITEVDGEIHVVVQHPVVPVHHVAHP